MIAYSMGRPSSRVRAATRDQKSRSWRNLESARHRRVGQSGLDTLSCAGDFCPQNLASHAYRDPASSSSGVGCRPAAKIQGASHDFGHADRLVVREQKSANVKSERAVADLKRFGGFSLSPGRFPR